MNKKEIIIIGTGFGGLSAAAFLAADGHNVRVLEKNNQPGGRANSWDKDGFHFDMGPSWYTMPDIVEKFFNEFGESAKDYYEIVRLDPSYRVFFDKNDILDLPSSLEEIYKLFDELEEGGADKLKKFLKQAKYQYDVSVESFLYKEYRNIWDMFNLRMIIEGSKLHLFDNMDSFAKRFFKNERARKLLQYTLVFLGGAPKKTPALYALMAYIDYQLGIWYPLGGMTSMVKAIQKLAEKKGAKFIFEQEVTEIIVKNSKAIGAKTKDNEYFADIIISNADYPHAENNLLPQKYRSYNKKYWQKKMIAPSALVLYLGLDTKVPNLDHHNLFLQNDWIEHFNVLFEHPNWPDKPSYYINCPSKTDPSVAPQGKETFFLLVPIPAGIKDTKEIRTEYIDKILTEIEDIIDFPIREHIEISRSVSINDYKSLYNAYNGTALGLSHTLMQTAFFRPKHRSRKVKNLFYTGQYTHPGIGMPVTLISSQVVRDIIRKEYGKKY